MSSLIVALVACTPSAPPDRTGLAPRLEEPVAPTPVHEPARAPALDTRVVGEIAGEFVVPKQAVRVAEPIMVAFEVRSIDGPIVVAYGGDQRNAAFFPTRVGVKVERLADLEVVCDSVTSPAIMSFGGLGGDRTLAEGELARESFVLNPSCPELATPGSYRVTLHRRLTSMAMTTKKPGEEFATSCDVHPLHEDASLEGLPAECVRLLRNVPSVTTSFELSVLPYDRDAVKTAIEAAYARADASDPKDEIAKSRIDAWLCGWVSCACGGTTRGRAVPLPETLPPKLEPGCRRGA